MFQRTKNAGRTAAKRRGASAVEFAMIAPVMIGFTFGLVELGRITLVKQTATHASREGARVAVRPTATTEEVLEVLNSAGIPSSAVRTLEQLLVDEDAVAAGLIYQSEHPRIGKYTLPCAPVTMSATDYRARDEIAEHGEHTDQLLEELGYDPETIERLISDGIVARRDG